MFSTTARKNIFIITITCFLLTLLLINQKYPFFHNISGPWIIGFNRINTLSEEIPIDQNNIISSEDIINSESLFLADPFFIIENDSIYLFVENQEKNKAANIDLFIITDSLILHKGTVFDPPYHTSYPQVFNYKGEFYMLPESKRSNNLILYKANNFPYEWSISDTLIKNVRLKDATLMINDDYNVIFTCNDDLELFMYCSNDLFSGWEECENYTKYFGNEVRPAGRIFKYNDKTFIPMQNLKLGYGTSVSLYEIIIKNNSIKLIKEMSGFLAPQIGKQHFNSSMHHIDIQEHNGSYIYFYDGRSLINKSFSLKRSLKYNYLDLKSIIYDIIF
jgi:hypothetical protein